MDPDVIREFEEQVRAMNAAMGNHNAAAGAQANMSDKTRQADQAGAEAKAKLKRTVDHASNALGSFASAALSTEEGFKKYNGAIDSAGKSISAAFSMLGPLGTILGKVVEAFSLIAGGALKLVDNLTSFRDNLSKVTGALPLTAEEIARFGREAKFSMDNLAKLQKVTTGLGTNLAGLGGLASDGAIKFMQMAAVSEDVRRKFGKWGYSVEQLAELQAKYVESLTASGRSYDAQNKSWQVLQKESIAYADNLVRLSALTGKSADELQKERNVEMMRYEEQVQTMAENAKLANLDKEVKAAELAGNKDRVKALTSEANLIRNEQQNRLTAMKTFSNMFGEEKGMQIGRVMRQGFFDTMTAPLAILMGDTALQLHKSGKQSSEDFANTLTGVVDTTKTAVTNMVVKTNDVLKVAGENVGKVLGAENSTVTSINRLADKAISNLNDVAGIQENLVAQNVDGLFDKAEDAKKAERDIQAAMQLGYESIASTVVSGVVPALQAFEAALTKVTGIINSITDFFGGPKKTYKDHIREQLANNDIIKTNVPNAITGTDRSKENKSFRLQNAQRARDRRKERDAGIKEPKIEPIKKVQLSPSEEAAKEASDKAEFQAAADYYAGTLKKNKSKEGEPKTVVPIKLQAILDKLDKNVDLERHLKALRMKEHSGRDDAEIYKIKTGVKGGTASGAYQFIDPKWEELTKKYGVEGYKRAMDAPPEIQDMIARFHVAETLKQANGDASKIPIKHYSGNIGGALEKGAKELNGGQDVAEYQRKYNNIYDSLPPSKNFNAETTVSKLAKPEPPKEETTNTNNTPNKTDKTEQLNIILSGKLDNVISELTELNSTNKRLLHAARN